MLRVANICLTIEGEMNKIGLPIVMVWMRDCSQVGCDCVVKDSLFEEYSPHELSKKIRSYGCRNVLFTKGDLMECNIKDVKVLLDGLKELSVDIETYGLFDVSLYDEYININVVPCIKTYGSPYNHGLDLNRYPHIKLMPLSISDLSLLLDWTKDYDGFRWVVPMSDGYKEFFDYVLYLDKENVRVIVPLQRVVDIK